MKQNTIFLLLAFLLAAAWNLHASAQQVDIAGKTYDESGQLEGPGITGSILYDAENKILTLDNAHITHHETALFNKVEDLRLVVKGDCSIRVYNTAASAGVCTNFPMLITGGGRLTIDAPGVGLLLNTCATFTVSIEDCTLDVRGGTYGIKGCYTSTFSIRNATVHAVGNTYDYSFALGHWGQILLADCAFAEPSGAHIGLYKHENVVLDAAGRAAREILVRPTLSAIAPIGDSTTPPTILAVYSPDGRRLSDPRPGLNLLRMSDGTTRKVMWPTQQ